MFNSQSNLVEARRDVFVTHHFFGSLSTFSTFAVEVLVTLRDRQWSEALLLTAGSVLAGLLDLHIRVGSVIFPPRDLSVCLLGQTAS